jgi:hypothetical protein
MKLALHIALVVLALGHSARADEIQYGTGVICDTLEQAQRVARLADDDTEAAVTRVNSEVHNPTACAIASVAYVRGAEMTTARSKAATFQIVEVLVVGVRTRMGYRSAHPATYFTLFRIDERAI